MFFPHKGKGKKFPFFFMVEHHYLAIPCFSRYFLRRLFSVKYLYISLCFLFQIDPVIQEGNEGIVHHMLLYECDDDFPRSNLSYEGMGSPDMPPAVRQCVGPSIIAGWAIGGQVLCIIVTM